MRQLSLLLPKELLNEPLFYLWGLESVQIHDLRRRRGQRGVYFDQALVGQPVQELSQQDLLSRQESSVKVEELEPFMPKKKLLKP